MKIYRYEPIEFVRLQITSQNEETQYLTLTDTTIEEVKQFCTKILETKNISPFTSGKKTSINIRKAIGGKNGKSESISFRGLTPNETMALIVTAINVIPK